MLELDSLKKQKYKFSLNKIIIIFIVMLLWWVVEIITWIVTYNQKVLFYKTY